MRFALAMVKVALVEVLQNYSFLVCEETEVMIFKLHTWSLWVILHNLRKQELSNLLHLSISQIPLKMDPVGLVGPLKPIQLKLAMR